MRDRERSKINGMKACCMAQTNATSTIAALVLTGGSSRIFGRALPQMQLSSRARSDAWVGYAIERTVSGSLQFGDVFELPGLVEERLGRRVETEDRKPALSRHGFYPVGLLLRRSGTEYDVERSIAVHYRLRVAAD